MSTDENKCSDDLLGGPGELLHGAIGSDEILIGITQAQFPRKPYCLVENWTIFRVDATEDELSKIQAVGQLQGLECRLYALFKFAMFGKNWMGMEIFGCPLVQEPEWIPKVVPV